MAKRLGADSVYKITPSLSEDQLVEDIRFEFNDAPDVVIECSGVESSVRTALLVF